MGKTSTVLIVTCMALTGLPLCAQNEITHIVISGQTGESQSFELLKYNRIVFGNNSMHLSSSLNPEIMSAELSYSTFKHIDFTDKPLSSLDEIIVSDASLVYHSREKALEVVANDIYEPFTIYVTNTGGAVVANLKTLPGYKVYLPSLPVGFYVAVAFNNDIQLKTKIIIQ